MQNSLIKKILQNSTRYTGLLLAILIGLFIVIIFSCLIVKYNNFGYNAIDLGIYTQVFYNTSQGNLFELSIHPHSYLGDHFEIFILFLIPIYKLFTSPITLLFLQTLFIGLSAWPLYLIGKKILPRGWALLIALAFLVNPFIINICFFEFHILPFAIFFLLWSYYFYQNNKFIPFLLFSLLALLIREDVSFVIFMFGILGLIDQRKKRWILFPIVSAGLWFIFAWHLTAYFNQMGSYKFFLMYGWLGNDLAQALKTSLTKPWLIFLKIVNINNILLVLGLVLPLAGLPLFKLKYLSPALLIFLQLFLLGFNSTLLLETHYASLLLPFIFIATLYALANLKDEPMTKNRIKRLLIEKKSLALIIFVTAIIYSFFTFSPLLGKKNIVNKNAAQAKSDLIAEVKPQEKVVASFDFLPVLSNRQHIYSLHYTFLGVKQFSQEKYSIPVQIDKMVVDFNDFNFYHLQAQSISRYQYYYPTGWERVNRLISDNKLHLAEIIDSYAVYEKGGQDNIKLFEKLETVAPNMIPASADQKKYTIKLLGWEKIEQDDNQDILPISFIWQLNETTPDDYSLEFFINRRGSDIYKKILPLGYGLYPTSQWPANSLIKTNHWFSLPEDYQPGDKFYIQVTKLKGYLGLDARRSASMEITDREKISEKIEINYSTR